MFGAALAVAIGGFYGLGSRRALHAFALVSVASVLFAIFVFLLPDRSWAVVVRAAAIQQPASCGKTEADI